MLKSRHTFEEPITEGSHRLEIGKRVTVIEEEDGIFTVRQFTEHKDGRDEPVNVWTIPREFVTQHHDGAISVTVPRTPYATERKGDVAVSPGPTDGVLSTLDEIEFHRASGLMECPICNKLYYDHPKAGPCDYTGKPFLHRTCDGKLWKL